jgi:hypothetical protein
LFVASTCNCCQVFCKFSTSQIMSYDL